MLAALMCLGFFQLISGQQIAVYYLKIIRHIKVSFYLVPACLPRVRENGLQLFEQGLEMLVAQRLDELSVRVDGFLCLSRSFRKPLEGIGLGKPELICNFKHPVDQIIEHRHVNIYVVLCNALDDSFEVSRTFLEDNLIFIRNIHK